MTLFFSLLPIYLFGNLHCAGMCGPLVMLLAKNRYRSAYFFGRLLAYSLAGLFSAEAGMLLFQTLSQFHLSAILSLGFGFTLLILGFFTLFRLSIPGTKWVAIKMGGISTLTTRFLSLQGPYPIFLFGMGTLLLPCGQTLVVFSACALEAKPLVGLINGSLFALLTTPSLFLSMTLFKRLRHSYHIWIGSATLLVGILALLRGFADLDLVNHFILNPKAQMRYHIVIY